MRCREGEYALGSNSKIRGNTTKLFCDLKSNFQASTNYELDNNIYYIIDENLIEEFNTGDNTNIDDNENTNTGDNTNTEDNENTNTSDNTNIDDNDINYEPNQIKNNGFFISNSFIQYFWLLLINM